MEDLEIQTKRNVTRNATKILHDIAMAYETGVFDDPDSCSMYCNLLALVCEGKVEGSFDEDKTRVSWKLTDDFSSQIDAIMQANAATDPNVVRGPW